MKGCIKLECEIFGRAQEAFLGGGGGGGETMEEKKRREKGHADRKDRERKKREKDVALNPCLVVPRCLRFSLERLPPASLRC